MDARPNLLFDLIDGSMMPVYDFFMSIMIKSYKIMSKLSKRTPFCRGIHVRSQNPLLSCLWLVDQSQRYLIQFQLKSWPKLVEFDLFVSYLLIGVMPKTYHIIFVRKCDDSLGIWLGHWEDMLQGCLYSNSKTCGEILENEMRINFWHRLQFFVDIMTKDYVLKPKIKSRSNRQMAQDKAVRLASMFMQKNNIRDAFPESQFYKFFKNCSTSVDSLSIREQDRQFLCELKEPIGRITRSCYQDLWVRIYGIGIFIIYS